MELTIEQTLQQGVAAHKEGKLQEAERFYRAILQSQPAHPDANHNLGVLAVSVNKADAALPLFKLALEANPKLEKFWLSYIDALIKEKQFENAYKIARWLDNNSKVTRVIYPGLESHKQFDLATKQHSSPDGDPVYGSMISFELDQSINLDSFAKQLSIITLAESLGGVKSLISCPYSMTHASVPDNEKMNLGITPNLLRFSVGIEHVDDLISELDFAMNL